MDGPKDEKKAKLIRATIENVRKHGIQKTTLEDIADASGMATTSTYYYFANKKDLLRATISTLLNQRIPRSLLRGGFSKKWPKS